jgi:hypothetical protein
MTLIENNTEVDHQEVKIADFPIMIKSVAEREKVVKILGGWGKKILKVVCGGD